MSKHQEQVLARSLGVPDDTYYSTTSWGCYSASSNWVEQGDGVAAYRHYFKYMGLRNYAVNYPAYLGMQVFDSTVRPRPQYNDCCNLKTRFVGHPFGIFFMRYSYPLSGMQYGKPFWRFTVPTGTVAETLPSKVDWSESQFASNRAWAEMQPRFQGDFQALNFLYELKDFKNIAKAIAALRPSEIVRTLKRAKAKIRAAQRAVDTGSATARLRSIASSASRTAAEVVLIKHFGIDPTIRDLVSLHDQLATSVRDAQHRFREAGQTGNARHYSEEISREDTRTMGRTSYNEYWWAKGRLKTDVFTATMSYTYDYTMRDKVDAFSRLYGFGLNAGVVWNAIPFTFLVDYFIKVGDAIESMQRDPNVLTTLHQYCESRLVTVKNGYTYVPDYRTCFAIINGGDAQPDQMITGYEGSYFQRRVVSPSKGIVLPRVKMPSVKQAVNIAALVRCFL